MASSGSLGLADSLREQRLSELHKRLSSAANEFPAFTHFALRSDDPLCWKSLHLANCDGLNCQIPALAAARKGWPGTRIWQLKRWERDFGDGLLSDSERGQFNAGIREWVWERSLTECCRDPNYQGGFMAVGQRLTINGRDWIGRLVDGTVRGMASCKGFHLMRRLAPQLLPDLLGVEQVANLDWNEQERLWMERLYETFPSESRHFGPVEILTLPMNVFATTARAIELQPTVTADKRLKGKRRRKKKLDEPIDHDDDAHIADRWLNGGRASSGNRIEAFATAQGRDADQVKAALDRDQYHRPKVWKAHSPSRRK